MKYKRILLKLSGEALMGDGEYGIDPKMLDSLDTVELIMEFEKEFDIQIPDDKAEAISTVGDAVAFIEEAKA